MNKNSGRLRIIFTSLAVLAIGQVIWWAHLLISMRQDVHFTTMILSESAFFISIWSLAMWSAFRFTQEQSGLRQTHTDFLGAITHELKTPLANIQLSFDTLERPDLNPEMRSKYIKRGQDAVTRLLSEIETVLVMTNVAQTGRAIRALSLSELVDHSVHVARELYGDKSMFEVDIANGLQVLASEEEVQLIIRSLIDNAVKYSTHVTNGALAKVSIRALAIGKKIELTIRDAGVGMTNDEIQNAFQPFWRSESSKKEAKSGTGLGLTLAQNLAQRMNLQIKLDSDGKNLGTCATVIFPKAG